jgi:hypothetical protein
LDVEFWSSIFWDGGNLMSEIKIGSIWNDACMEEGEKGMGRICVIGLVKDDVYYIRFEDGEEENMKVEQLELWMYKEMD